MKLEKIFERVIFLSSILFAVLYVLPFSDGKIGYDYISFNLLAALAYVLPVAASLIVLVKTKYVNLRFVSLILFASSAVININLLNGGSVPVNPFVIIAIVLEFAYSLILLYLVNGKATYSTSEIVETAIFVALAVALDLPGMKIQLNAAGGSISFTMIPLFIIALRQSPLKTFISCGVIYGVITCILDGHNFFSYPLDYLLGYGAIAITSYFSYMSGKKLLKNPVLDYVALALFIALSGVARLAASTLSGIIFYETDFVASLVYNAAYVLPSAGICIVAILLLYTPIKKINQKFPTKNATL